MLGRAHRVAPLLESIEENTPEPHRVVFGLTPGDDAVLAEVDRLGAERVLVERRPFGDYARKIHAVVDSTDEPFIFTGADDLRFHPGWYTAARVQMDDRVGVVGTNDLHSRRVKSGQHATHFLVARWYVERFGTIDEPGKVFYEGYPHEFVDDELVATARKRKAWAFARVSHVEHLHPSYGLAETDPTYEQQGERMRVGRPIFLERRRLWT
jgi:hypothetical protein